MRYNDWSDNVDGGVSDCSAFTRTVYKKCGLTIRRSSREQFKDCTEVTQPQAGDLVFFCENSKTPSGITHVGIATGNGYGMIHCGSSKGVEHVNNFYNAGNWYSKRFYKIARHPKLSGGSGKQIKNILGNMSLRNTINNTATTGMNTINKSVAYGKGKFEGISKTINNAYNSSKKQNIFGKGNSTTNNLSKPLNHANSLTSSNSILSNNTSNPSTNASKLTNSVNSLLSGNSSSIQKTNTISTRHSSASSNEVTAQLLKIIIELITKIVNNGSSIAQLIQILTENGIVVKSNNTKSDTQLNKDAGRVINNIVKSMDSGIDNSRFDGMIKALTELASE